MTDRVYYRSTLTGQRGFLVETQEGARIQFDQRDKELVKFTHEWQPEQIRPKLNRIQCSRIAWAADRELAQWLGDPQDKRKDWLNIDDDKRIDFAHNGPNAGRERIRLYRAIMEALECSDD